MKNIIKTIAFLLVAGLLFVGCQKDTSEGRTYITLHPIQLLGDNPLLVEAGTPFVDPGFTCIEQDGTDSHNKVVVTGIGDVDTDEMGFYYITYSIDKNIDGFPSSVVRTVIVCNPDVTTDISGGYRVNADETYRTLLSSGAINYFNAHANAGNLNESWAVIVVTRVAPGFFRVTDMLGGWYYALVYPQYKDQYNFKMDGYIALDNAGTITLVKSLHGYWGDELDYLLNGFYDETAKTLEWNVGYAGSMDFYVFLNKIN